MDFMQNDVKMQAEAPVPGKAAEIFFLGGERLTTVGGGSIILV